MKNISLKLQVTLLYTVFMTLLTCAALAVLFSLSSRELLTSTQSKLENRVQESAEYIALRGGDLRIDTDFYSLRQDIYLALYDSNMYFMYGRLPKGFDSQPDLADGELQTVRDGTKEWYVYDMSYMLSDDKTVYIRGVTSVTDAEESFIVTVRFALILLPLIVAVMAVAGYRFTSRTLRPVRQITETVQKIRSDSDLSRRISLTQGGRRHDEIYTLADTFDEMLEELEAVFNREKQFTSDVSHELRTPVSVILAECDLLLCNDSFKEDQKKEIRLIRKKAKNMADMISRLLFLSRADQGRQPLKKELLNLSDITEMTVEEQQILADAQGRGVKIIGKIEPGIFTMADETFYIRMLVNLISNAMRYSPDGEKVEVKLIEKDESVIGSVTDHGIGISEKDLPHIWERFYRADTARTDSGHSGLGLSMVKWIVEAHGGSVYAESREGEGSRFVFYFPIQKKKNED